MIPIKDLTDVTLAIEDTDEDEKDGEKDEDSDKSYQVIRLSNDKSYLVKSYQLDSSKLCETQIEGILLRI